MDDPFQEFLSTRGSGPLLPRPRPQEAPGGKPAGDPFQEFLATTKKEAPSPSAPADSPLADYISQRDNVDPTKAPQPPASPAPGDDPSFLGVAASSLTAGFSEVNRQEALIQSSVKSLLSGGSFAPNPKEVPLDPQMPPEVTRYTETPWTTENTWDPKRWVAHIGVGIGSNIMPIAAGILGGAVGGIPGGAVAFSGTKGMLGAYPRYRAAVKEGLSPSDASERALKESILDTATSAASWAAFGMPLFGTVAREEAAGIISNAMKLPFMEALAQIGLIQPAIGQVQHLGEAFIRGRATSPEEIIQNWGVDAALGGLQLGAFHGAGMLARGALHARGVLRAGVRPFTPPSEESLRAAYGDMEPQLDPITTYTRMQEKVTAFEGNKRSAGEWLNDFGQSIPSHALNNLIPHWAVDSEGNVSKESMQQAILSRNIGISERGVNDLGVEQIGLREQIEGALLGSENLVYQTEFSESLDSGGRRQASLENGFARDTPPTLPHGMRLLNYFADRGFRSIKVQKEDSGFKALMEAAERLGLDTGILPDRVSGGYAGHYIDLDARASSEQITLPYLKMGLAPDQKIGVTYPDREAKAGVFSRGTYTPSQLRPAARLLQRIVGGWATRFKMEKPVEIKIYDDDIPSSPGSVGLRSTGANGHIIEVSLKYIQDAADLFGALTHEFGHALFYDWTGKIPQDRMDYILQKFSTDKSARQTQEFMEQLTPEQQKAVMSDRKLFTTELTKARAMGADYKMGEVIREPAVFVGGSGANNPLLSSQSPTHWAYLMSFQEWLANNVAKWATTDAKPLSELDTEFSALGKQIRRINEDMSKEFKRSFDPAASMKDWVESFFGSSNPWTMHQIMTQGALDGMAANHAALVAEGGSGNGAVPPTSTTTGGRKFLSNFGGGGQALAAHADKISVFSKWALNLKQVTIRNMGIRGLVMYNEMVNLRDLMIKTTWNRGFDTLRAWHKLGREGGDALASFIYDYKMQRYRTPEEIQKNIQRMPRKDEFDALVLKHKVSDEGLKVFQKLRDDFQYTRDRTEYFELREAQRIENPERQAQAIDDIKQRYKMMKDIPFFPETRFGNYTMTILDGKGRKVRLETAKTETDLNRLVDAWEKTKVDPDETAVKGMLNPNVEPFFGLPPGLLKAMEEKLKLTDEQKDALRSLRVEYSPANSFTKRFFEPERLPGWSQDFKRVYASYMHSYGKWMANLEYAPIMRSMIDEIGKSGKDIPVDQAGVVESVRRDQIKIFASDHFQQLMNPTHDISLLRGALFHWFLGLSPAKAFVNLTQTAMASYPFLATQFGDFRAIKAITKASTSLRSFYKTGSYADLTGPEMKAMAEGVREGTLREGQAVELGAMTNYDNLAETWARSANQKTWRFIAEKSSYLFDMAEQFNRRVVFRAAWNLAMDNPKAKYIDQAKGLYPLQYQRMLDRGFNEKEASAFVAAKMATEETQFVYAPHARPRFMWGKKGTLFAFKNFTQNMLFMLGNYPGVRMRGLLMLGAMGGMMGLPGAEDISSLLKGIAWKAFGKDFDLDDQVRHFTQDILNGKLDPDLLLHGFSRHGFGLPQLTDMAGLNAGRTQKPGQPINRYGNFDMSASVGMGRIMPVDVGNLLSAHKSMEQPQMQALQQSLGAGFGFGVALYQALAASHYDLNDMKRWEPILPAAIRDANRSYRYYHTGMERNAQGNPILRFDPTEPIHTAEIIGNAMGFRPARLTEQYDNMRAEAEAEAMWTIRQQLLMRQFWYATQAKDSESRKRVIQSIRDFNASVRGTPARAYAITDELLSKSMTTRATSKAKQEAGLPLSTKDIPLAQDVRRLHPGASVVGRSPVQ